MSADAAASSDPDLADLDARRRTAITESGWSAQVRVLQPRNLAFWVWALLVGWVLLLWVQILAGDASYYAPATGLAVAVFAGYGTVFCGSHSTSTGTPPMGACRPFGLP